MTEGFSPEQLQQLREVIREVIREELADSGLRLDGTEHQDEAREDFRFLRRIRKMWDGAVGRVGTAVLGAVVTVAFAIIGAGLWAWLGSHLQK